MRRVLRNTACILSSWWRVFGSPRSSNLVLPVPAINRGLLGGLPWPFSWDEADLASCAELELALHQLVASLQGQLGFGEFGLLLPNPLQLSPFARDREIRGSVPGRVWPGSRCCMRPNSHGSLSRVNHLEHAGRDQPGGHIRVVVVVGGEAQLPRRRLPCPVGLPPGREVLHRDKTLIRQCRLDEPRDALEDHEVPGGLVELSHCVRVHSGNLLWWCHQLIRRHRHGVGGRDFRLQDRRSRGPLEPKWWPKWILIKSQDKRPPAVNALAQTLQSTTLVLLIPYSQNGASFMPHKGMGGLPSSTGQLPSAADGSRIDAIPNGRIASAANTNGRAGRWGGPPSPYAVWSRCRISGPSAPVRAAVRLRTLGGAWEGVSGPSAPVPSSLP